MSNKKKTTMLLPMAATTAGVYAQGDSMASINKATRTITSYFGSGIKLIYTIDAMVDLIGGIKVYNKFSSGDSSTNKTVASWFGTCISLIVAATILCSFFL